MGLKLQNVFTYTCDFNTPMDTGETDRRWYLEGNNPGLGGSDNEIPASNKVKSNTQYCSLWALCGHMHARTHTPTHSICALNVLQLTHLHLILSNVVALADLCSIPLLVCSWFSLGQGIFKVDIWKEISQEAGLWQLHRAGKLGRSPRSFQEDSTVT